MLVTVGQPPKQPVVSTSVKLRRKNRAESDLDPSEVTRRNRHSGDFSHWSPSRRLQEERKLLRKSGDWSYLSFPTQQLTTIGKKAPPISPAKESGNASKSNLRTANSIVLENKVLSSLVRKEEAIPNSPADNSDRYASSGPEPARCNSAMETLDRKTGSNETNSISRRKIKDSNRNGADTFRECLRPANFCKDPKSGGRDRSRRGRAGREGNSDGKRRSRSQPRQQHSHLATSVLRDAPECLVLSDSRSAASGSVKTPTGQHPRGLGRRSATQLELSNRQKNVCNGEDGDRLKQKNKRWTSSEHIRETLVRNASTTRQQTLLCCLRHFFLP